MVRQHQTCSGGVPLRSSGAWSCVLDQTWLHLDHDLPSWDQAEYLSSAIDHGRQLGLLNSGQWEGFKALLDLSQKIPPLSSIISGSLMAVVGQTRMRRHGS